MPRKVRVEFEGAVYHVMCRGNHQEAIYRDEGDCRLFLKTLGEVYDRCGWRVYAFVLMGNHYHLLFETPEANLVDGMRWLQGAYTQRFNARHKTWGHLFQGRYKALLVDPDGDYFSTVMGYIHLNPARAKRFDLEGGKLSDYKWSSHTGYLRLKERPEWLFAEEGLKKCGFVDDISGRARYRYHMQKRVSEILHSRHPMKADEQWSKLRRGWIFGSDDFRIKMEESVGAIVAGKRRESYSGEAIKKHDERSAEKILEMGLAKLDLKRSELVDIKKSDHRKKVIAWLIRKNTSVKNEWIAARLKMGNPSAVSRGAGEVERVKEGDLWKLKENINIQGLTPSPSQTSHMSRE